MDVGLCSGVVLCIDFRCEFRHYKFFCERGGIMVLAIDFAPITVVEE